MTPPNISELRIKYRDLKNSADANKLQALVWLHAFLKASGKSQYALESFLSASQGRQKADRIRYLKNISSGYRPSRMHSQREMDIVEVLHNQFGHEEIMEWLCSPFWHVISEGFSLYARNPETIRAILAESIELTRWNVSSTALVQRPERYFTFEQSLQMSRKTPERRMKIPGFLIAPASFDQLAVLGVLFREAYIGCAIGYAAQIRSLFIEKLNEMLEHPYIKEELKGPLFDLTIKRVLCPIRQTRRNESKNLESSFKNVSSPSQRPEELMGFLKSHDKTIQRI